MKKWLLTAVVAAGFAAQGMAQAPAPAAAPMTSAPMVLTGNGSCCMSDCCDDGCRGGSIIADIGFMFLRPRWNDNPAGMKLLDDDIQAFSISHFDFGSEVTPRISLGYAGSSGAGARINWWRLKADQTVNFAGFDDGFTVSAMPLGLQELSVDEDEVLSTSAALHMDVWDLEAIYTFSRCSLSGLVAGGIRYSHISQGYIALDIDSDGEVEAALVSGHNFNGAGPTLALEGRGGERLFIYGNLRGSLLFGNAKQVAVHFDDGDADAIAAEKRSVVIPVGEIEIGAGFKTELCGMNAFLQMGFNAQAWGSVGNSSRSNIRPYDVGGNPFDDTAPSVDNSTLGLIGFTLRGGLTY